MTSHRPQFLYGASAGLLDFAVSTAPVFVVVKLLLFSGTGQVYPYPSWSLKYWGIDARSVKLTRRAWVNDPHTCMGK